MKWAFLISGIVELIGSFICYTSPELVYQGGSAYMMQLYGLAALTLGIINILVFTNFEESKLTKTLGISMMFFHAAVAMKTFGIKSDNITYQNEAIITHVILFLLFLVGYMNGIKPDDNKKL